MLFTFNFINNVVRLVSIYIVIFQIINCQLHAWVNFRISYLNVILRCEGDLLVKPLNYLRDLFDVKYIIKPNWKSCIKQLLYRMLLNKVKPQRESVCYSYVAYYASWIVLLIVSSKLKYSTFEVRKDMSH